MNQKNIFQKTPQFIQLISQYSQQTKGDYAQIFITKSSQSSNVINSNQSQCANFNNSQSQIRSNDSSPLKKSANIQQNRKKDTNSYQNGYEQIQAQWMKKVDTLNRQIVQQNKQNLLKRGKECTQFGSALQYILCDNWKDYQETQKIQIIKKEQGIMNQYVENELTSKGQDKQFNLGTKKRNHVNLTTIEEKSHQEQNDRVTANEQIFILPKNDRNKPILTLKQRDQRQDRQSITNKQVAHFSKSSIEQQDKKKAIQHRKVSKKSKESNKEQGPIIDKTKVDLFDSIIQQFKQSGEVKTIIEKRALKEELINQTIDERQTKIHTKSQKKKNMQENSQAVQTCVEGSDLSNEVKRHNKREKKDKEILELSENDELIDDLNILITEQGDKENINQKILKEQKKPNEQKNNFQVSDKLADFLDNQLISSYKSKMKNQSKQNGTSNQNEAPTFLEYKIDEDNLNQDKLQNKKGLQKNKKIVFQSFEPYWSSQEMQKAIEEKRAFKGVYSANEKNQYLGRIKIDEMDEVVFVNSYKDQNRALHNSLVGFVIVSGDASNRLKGISQSMNSSLKEHKQDNQMNNVDQLNKNIEQEQSNDVEEQEQGVDTEDGLTHIHSNKLVAKVVYIYDNPYQQHKIVGYLQELQEDKPKKLVKGYKKKYWFIPKFSKLPHMIPVEFTEEFNTYVEENDIDISKVYVTAQIKEWGEDSFYGQVRIEECVGNRGDIEVECDALLKEFNVYHQDFKPETEEYLTKFREQLNQKGEYVIPESERLIRWDLTNEIICTIDPHDAKDLDDALSVKHLHDDIYEIGVHIADVSHFVQPNTPLDEDARLRTTSVYLVHKVIPMLPRLLCENLCSLNPNVERLAFTVFFQMKEDGEVLWDGPIRIGKSIINSCNKLSYDVVQQMIEKKIKTPEELPEGNQPREGVDKDKMFESLLLLARLGMNRREQRFTSGVLTIDSIKKRFKLNDKLWPVDYAFEERKDANFVVEEFMLLANQIIAKAMVKQCKSLTVLRQHSYPSVDKQNELNLLAKKLGHEFDFSSLETINQSIERVKRDDTLSVEKKLFLKKQIFLVLEQAQYFVADQLPTNEWKHFALNFDVYTHFTSPIRRYPDLLVHRVMNSMLENKENVIDSIDRQSLLDIMTLCNDNKIKAKLVSDNCSKIFMCLYLKDHSVESQGMVISFGITNMTVFIPDYEIQRIVYFQDYRDIIKVKIEKEKEGNKLVIIYKTKNMAKQNTASFSEFSPIIACLTSTDTFPIDYKIKFTIPDPEDKSITHLIE